jgi:uncharacterized protein (TIGR03000 family)
MSRRPRQLQYLLTCAAIGAAAALTAAMARAAPPFTGSQGGLYPSYSYSYYPAYRPSTSPFTLGPQSSAGYYAPAYGYVPSTGFSPGYTPGFAASYGRVGPAAAPLVPQSVFTIPRVTEEADNTARIEVLVPAGATLWFNDWKSQATGAVRKLQSPPLTPGRRYTYTVRVRWEENGREVTQTRQVPVTAGASVRVDFLAPPGNDKR